jgi:hypothetical protein
MRFSGMSSSSGLTEWMAPDLRCIRPPANMAAAEARSRASTFSVPFRKPAIREFPFFSTSLHGPGREDLPAAVPGAGPHLDEPVGLPEHTDVVVHDHHGVAHIDQVAHDSDQPVDVGGMQADGGLVEDVEDPGSVAPHRPRQLYALAFPGGKGGACPVEGEVSQAEGEQALGVAQELCGDGLPPSGASPGA